MSGGITFRTTSLDLMVSIVIDADCEIIEILPAASEVIKRSITSFGTHRITKVGTHTVSDRIHLREVLMSLDPDVAVDVELVGQSATSTESLNNSVHFNGTPCEFTLVPPKRSIALLKTTGRP